MLFSTLIGTPGWLTTLEPYIPIAAFIIAIPGAVYAVIRVYRSIKEALHKRTPLAQKTAATEFTDPNILLIRKSKPSRKPPIFLSAFLVIDCLVILGFSGLLVYIIITQKPKLDIWSLIYFVLIFVILPIFVLWDTLVIQPRLLKQKMSRVAKQGVAVVQGGADEIFGLCLTVLDEMQTNILEMKKPTLVVSRIKSSIITLRLRRVRGSKVRVYVLSDSEWLTVRVDAGVNQKHVDKFLELLRHKRTN